MSRRTVFSRGVAAVVALVVPFWLMASPASAFEVYTKGVTLEHTFTDPAGDEVTCQVGYTSQLLRESKSVPFDAEAITEAFSDLPGGDDAQCTAFVGVEIAHRDSQGRERHLRAFGTDVADLQVDQLGTTFVASHFGFFQNCADNCDFSYTTTPK